MAELARPLALLAPLALLLAAARAAPCDILGPVSAAHLQTTIALTANRSMRAMPAG